MMSTNTFPEPQPDSASYVSELEDIISNDGEKKSSMRQTKHLLTNADSSTDTKVGWTKNTPKPNFFWKMEKITHNAKIKKKRLEICQN